MIMLITILCIITPLSRSGINILAPLILVLWLADVVFLKRKMLYIPILYFIGVCSAVMLLSLINALDVQRGLMIFADEFLKFSLIFFIILQYFQTKRSFERALLYTSFSALIALSFALYQHWVQSAIRSSSTFNNANPFGTFAMIVLFLSAAYALFGNGILKLRIASAALSFMAGVGLFLSGSRGAWLGAVAGLLPIGYVVIRKIGVVKTFAVLVCIAAVSYFAVPQKVIDTVKGKAVIDSSVNQRFMMNETALTLIKENPIIGIGIGQFPLVYPLYKQPKAHELTHIHNIYLHCLTEIGFIGFACVGFFIVYVLRLGYKKRTKIAMWYYIGMCSVVLGIVIHGIVDWTILNTQIGVLIAILAAFLVNGDELA